MNPIRAKPRSLSQAFAELRLRNEIGLVPFIPAGYPDLPTTAALLPALERGGATVIEIGFPFSDPIADGPVIQEAFVETLARKVKIADVFATVAAGAGRVDPPRGDAQLQHRFPIQRGSVCEGSEGGWV